MPAGSAGRSGMSISLIDPEVVTRPIRPGSSVNHNAPSGPAVIPRAKLPTLRKGNSASTPEGEIRPTRSPCSSTNHAFPSGPAVIPAGELRGASGNSLIVCAWTRPARASAAAAASIAAVLRGRVMGASVLEGGPRGRPGGDTPRPYGTVPSMPRGVDIRAARGSAIAPSEHVGKGFPRRKAPALVEEIHSCELPADVGEVTLQDLPQRRAIVRGQLDLPLLPPPGRGVRSAERR